MQPDYLAYMLRLWQVETHGQLTWRASLEKPGTEERHSFISIYELLAFLEQQTNQTKNYTFQHHVVEQKENEDISIEIKITLKSPKNVKIHEK